MWHYIFLAKSKIRTQNDIIITFNVHNIVVQCNLVVFVIVWLSFFFVFWLLLLVFRACPFQFTLLKWCLWSKNGVLEGRMLHFYILLHWLLSKFVRFYKWTKIWNCVGFKWKLFELVAASLHLPQLHFAKNALTHGIIFLLLSQIKDPLWENWNLDSVIWNLALLGISKRLFIAGCLFWRCHFTILSFCNIGKCRFNSFQFSLLRHRKLNPTKI